MLLGPWESSSLIMSLIEVRAGKTVLTLSPNHGASILSFTHDGQNMFKPVESGWGDDRNPLKTSCFPLVPYSNRIRNAQFEFEGKTVVLGPACADSNSDHNHALHGIGWVRPWTLTREAADACECVYGKSLNDVTVDNCFTQWGGGATIKWPNKRYGMHISAPPGLGFAVVYVPEKQNYFCFEPVTHMNDAVNWSGKDIPTGLKILKPGQTLSATTTFMVTE